MADRYNPNRNRFRDRAPDYEGERSWRQEEQFRSSGGSYAPSGYDTSYGQMGETGGSSDYQDESRFDHGWDRNERFGSGGGYSRQREDSFRQAPRASGYQQGYGASGSRFASFTSEDQGGADFTAPTGRWSSGYSGTARGASDDRYRGAYRGDDGFTSSRYSDRPRRRDWWDRTTDEIASWFGDDDAGRRREQDHRGRGPSDYTRSDDRIREDVNDNLTKDWAVDARKVRVKVENCEVTLDGTVPTRLQKRRAEDCAEDVSGVTHVQNNLRVGGEESDRSDYSSTASGSATKS